MASHSRLAPVVVTQAVPFCGPTCQCLTDFFREEFIKHRRCLDEQREYFSDGAIEQAQVALGRILAEVERLSQREDAGEVIGELLRKFDLVTNLSAWTEPKTLH